ncbi:hypothetical protein [Rhodoflexus caldus]|uniref:hypothetical protein n=1 Tax=Rhodoflexus caldus TaxID=2891236 RepID=UPI00202AB4C3|nr:hypothetical protein [Rhodoflexus caldus]
MQPKVFDGAEFMQLSKINQRFGIRIEKNQQKTVLSLHNRIYTKAQVTGRKYFCNLL